MSGMTETVSIPHTWNAEDATDEVSGFHRGEGVYEKTVCINEDNLHIVSSCISRELLRQGDNEMMVLVDNSHNPDIPPLSADFTFWGGISRDITLVVTPRVHVSPTHFATSGVYIDTFDEEASQSGVRIRTFLSNDMPFARRVTLIHDIYGPAGAECCEDIS